MAKPQKCLFKKKKLHDRDKGTPSEKRRGPKTEISRNPLDGCDRNFTSSY